jgi:hypothetical protein
MQKQERQKKEQTNIEELKQILKEFIKDQKNFDALLEFLAKNRVQIFPREELLEIIKQATQPLEIDLKNNPIMSKFFVGLLPLDKFSLKGVNLESVNIQALQDTAKKQIKLDKTNIHRVFHECRGCGMDPQTELQKYDLTELPAVKKILNSGPDITIDDIEAAKVDMGPAFKDFIDELTVKIQIPNNKELEAFLANPIKDTFALVPPSIKQYLVRNHYVYLKNSDGVILDYFDDSLNFSHHSSKKCIQISDWPQQIQKR